jgi:hypothetical protein
VTLTSRNVRFCHFSHAKCLAIIFRGASRHALDRLIGEEF